MKKSIIVLGMVMLLILLSPFVKGYEEKAKAREFAARYGWKVKDEVSEIAGISIPDPLDSVYKRYNVLQKEMGFDLGRYCGRKAKRYTYEVLNHKFGEGVCINVIMYGGEVIAADVMTKALDGFMHAVNRREYVNEAG